MPSRTVHLPRARVSLACTSCRARHVRCDGRRPSCIACGRRGAAAACFYERPNESPTRGNSHTPAATANALTAKASNSTHTQAGAHPKPSMQASPFQNGTGPETVPTQPPPPRGTDGVATVDAAESNGVVYGDSSTIIFVQHISQVIDDDAESSNGVQKPKSPRAGPGRSTTTLPEVIRPRDPDADVYPRRTLADHFLSCYWECIHPLFPVLHQTSFTAQYEGHCGSSRGHETADLAGPVDRALFPAMLNLTFALGCQFSLMVPASEKSATADVFYQRSRRLFNFDILDSDSLSFLQLHLLQGIYLQSSQYATRCWNVVGVAIRVAIHLGLHRDTPAPKETQRSREMRRRLWHTCVVLDRLLAMTFGKPMMISSSDSVPLPMLIDDEYLRDEAAPPQNYGLNGSEGTQPPARPSRLGMFVSSSQMFDILSDILNTFYAGGADHKASTPPAKDRPRGGADLIATVLEFNRRLDTFAESIPEHLQVAEEPQADSAARDSCVSVQQQVLYCRLLYIRILSLRPLLLQAMRRGRSRSSVGHDLPSLDETVVDRCCHLCVMTAHSLIQMIHQPLGTIYRSSGWHSVYFTFASAIILLAAASSPRLNTHAEGQSIDQSWERAMAILEHYKDQVPSAPHAMQTLQRLRARIGARRTQRDDATGDDGLAMPLFDSDNAFGDLFVEPADMSSALDTMPFDFPQFDLHADGWADAWLAPSPLPLDDLVPDQTLLG